MTAFSDELAEWKRMYWTRLMITCAGNVRRMSEVSGVNSTYIYRKLKQYGLKTGRKRGNAAWQALQ